MQTVNADFGKGLASSRLSISGDDQKSVQRAGPGRESKKAPFHSPPRPILIPISLFASLSRRGPCPSHFLIVSVPLTESLGQARREFSRCLPSTRQ